MQTPTLTYHAQTRPAIPAQLGRLTLYRAAELSDSVGCIVTVCRHIYSTAGHEIPERYAARLEALNGDTLTLARARHAIALWSKWTRATELPDIVTVEGFLFALRNIS